MIARVPIARTDGTDKTAFAVVGVARAGQIDRKEIFDSAEVLAYVLNEKGSHHFLEHLSKTLNQLLEVDVHNNKRERLLQQLEDKYKEAEAATKGADE